MNELRRRIEIAGVNFLMSLPKPVLRLLAGSPRELNGHTLDPRFQLLLAINQLQHRPMASTSLRAARAETEWRAKVLDVADQTVPRMEDRHILLSDGPCHVRVYHPELYNGALPAIVYYHGGGFTVGTIESYDACCHRLARLTGATVISVEYHLAPEHKFPEGVIQAFEAYRYISEHADAFHIQRNNIAVAGDSAGGCFAAVVAHMARDTAGVVPPSLQVLIYPSTGANSHKGRLRKELREGFGLDRDMLDWFTQQYLVDPDTIDPRLQPLVLASHKGLAPAIVVTAEFDLLSTEGIEYADKLRAANSPVHHMHYGDMWHGFINMGRIPRARDVIAEIAGAIHDVLFEQSAWSERAAE